LSACSRLDPQPTPDSPTTADHWRAKGKFVYRSAERTESGNFDWRQHGQQYELRLYGPLALGTVRITGSSNTVRIRSRQQDLSSDQPQHLLKRVTGLALPLQALPAWLSGQPASPRTVILQIDHQGRPLRFTEQGWQLRYEGFQAGNPAIPATILATADGIRLRLLVKSFTTQPPAPP